MVGTMVWAQQLPPSYQTAEWNELIIPIPPDFNAQWRPGPGFEESVNDVPVLNAGADYLSGAHPAG